MQDSPNRDLIGQPGGRDRLQTPCLVLDLDAAEANIAAMAAHAREAGIGLRPHAKAHKSVALARRQLDAGATGICVATVGEAEALAEGGIGGLLLTSPVAGAAKLRRLAELARAGHAVMAAVDHPDAVAGLAAAMAGAAVPLTLLVDMDVGQHRTGVPDADTALDLARAIADAPGLAFGGLQAYAGHVQHIAGLSERRAAMERPWALIQATRQRLAGAGLAPAIVTGAGTGTHALDAGAGQFTEMQTGSYVFTDVQYDAVVLREAVAAPFRPALFVACSVVSTHQDGFVTTDGGLKRFATDGPAPRPMRNAPAGTGFRFSGDEFGALLLNGAPSPARGTVIECQVPHCDPTVDLYDWYHVVRGDRLVEIWPVEGRGAI